MLLLIDAGNSYLKWNFASAADKQLVASTQSADWESNHLINSAFTQWQDRGDISRVIMSSVVNDERNNLVFQWVKAHSPLEVELVQSQRTTLWVTNAYENPAQLGVDRWVALIACADLFPKENCIVVDCGTAMTIDTVLANGTHKGGVIFPGLQLMKNSLLGKTDIASSLVKNGFEQNKELEIFNHTTASAIQNGVLNAVVAGITSSASAMAKKCNEKVRVVITGGDAPYLLPHLSPQYHQEPDLIMKGLLAMAVKS